MSTAKATARSVKSKPKAESGTKLRFSVTSSRATAFVNPMSTKNVFRTRSKLVSAGRADASEVARLAEQVGHLQAAIAASLPAESEKRDDFERLAREWREETRFDSSASDRDDHPAVRQIIAMGEVAVPWILREWERQGGFWGGALCEITGENPVEPAAAGDFENVRAAWVRWAREHGYHW
jgi:hypothetical protein